MVDFEIARLFWFMLAILASAMIALDSKPPLSTPVAAVVRVSSGSAAECGIVGSCYRFGAAVNRAVMMFVLFVLRWWYAVFLSAHLALDNDGIKPPRKLELGRTTQAAKYMPPLLTRGRFPELLSAILACELDFGLARPLLSCVLSRAVHVVHTKPVYAPTLDFDWRLAVCAQSVKHIVTSADVLLTFMTLDVVTGRWGDNSPTSAIA